MYKLLLKPMFFRLDPEKVHNRMIKLGHFMGDHKLFCKYLDFLYNYKNDILKQEIMGIEFENPIGLSAGFDKNAYLPKVIGHVGFGFEEIGSFTGEPCKGNSGKRLFRLPKEKSLVVHYGLMNDGAEAIKERLKKMNFELPIGISIARTNVDDCLGEKAVKDYIKSFNLLHEFGSYTTINVSCPNLSKDDGFQNSKNLELLLKGIKENCKIFKPVFIKFKPDLNDDEIDELILVVRKYDFIKGFIISNLSSDRRLLKYNYNDYPGGFSGKPIKFKANEVLKKFYIKTKGEYILIGAGGVFTAEDAYTKIKLGASLIQMITGMIYEGPSVVKKINKGLVELLKEDGFSNIKEAIGIDAM